MFDPRLAMADFEGTESSFQDTTVEDIQKHYEALFFDSHPPEDGLLFPFMIGGATSGADVVGYPGSGASGKAVLQIAPANGQEPSNGQAPIDGDEKSLAAATVMVTRSSPVAGGDEMGASGTTAQRGRQRKVASAATPSPVRPPPPEVPMPSTKGLPWTEAEHRFFLEGVMARGKGDWKTIAKDYVTTRTVTQVASHAQKFFIRLSQTGGERRRRASIHDIRDVQFDPSRPRLHIKSADSYGQFDVVADHPPIANTHTIDDDNINYYCCPGQVLGSEEQGRMSSGFYPMGAELPNTYLQQYDHNINGGASSFMHGGNGEGDGMSHFVDARGAASLSQQTNSYLQQYDPNINGGESYFMHDGNVEAGGSGGSYFMDGGGAASLSNQSNSYLQQYDHNINGGTSYFIHGGNGEGGGSSSGYFVDVGGAASSSFGLPRGPASYRAAGEYSS